MRLDFQTSIGAATGTSPMYTHACGMIHNMKETERIYKLATLYMLSKLDTPISTNRLSFYLLKNNYTDYFTFQQGVGELLNDRWLDTMTVEATTARARKSPENTLVAKDKDKVVGFAVYSPSRDEDLPDAGEVDAIYVLSEYYGRKVGYRLMNEAISRLSEYDTVFVWVFEANERAIRFYHRYGFEFDGAKKQWTLGTPVNIVRMVKKINR